MFILKEQTRSLCPICFQEIIGQIYEEDSKAFMKKNCPQHGDFTFMLENDANLYKKLMNKDILQQRVPFETLLFAASHSCNLNCSICYLPNRNISELTLEDIKRSISNFSGPHIRFAGGEPTLRGDLFELLHFTRSLGKSTLIVTNGLKLTDRNYVKELKNSGLELVCFSFNGFSDEVYKKINGRPLLKIKLKALKNLMKEKIKIVLSVMLLKGVNEDEFKKIYHFYIKNLRYFHMLRIRTAVCSGRYNVNDEQIYLSDIIKMISKTIGVSYNDLIDFHYSLHRDSHLPCQFEVWLKQLLFKKIEKSKNSLPFSKIQFFVALIKEVGVRNIFFMVKRKIQGENPFFNYRISIRIWPDKYRIDLEEIKRCPTSHFVGETGENIPYCLGLILNNKFFLL